jgi:hypothetical protein
VIGKGFSLMLKRKRKRFVSPDRTTQAPPAKEQSVEEFLKSLETYRREDLSETESQNTDSSKN